MLLLGIWPQLPLQSSRQSGSEVQLEIRTIRSQYYFPFYGMSLLTLRANSSALTSSPHCILCKCSRKISRLDARSGGLTYNIRSIRPGLSKAESCKAIQYVV